MKAIRLLVVSSSLPYFKAIEDKLKENNIEVIAMCRTSNEAVSLFQQIEADIVIMDLYWSEIYLPTVPLIRKLRAQRPSLKLIGVTRRFEQSAIQDLKKLAIQGYIIISPHKMQRVTECIQLVYEGHLYYKLFPHE